ncbi:MAG: glycosyltransferase family 2 protein [Calditrichaeota bacterium]|nr:glycosyltransferase family 2 protein [Calditrichota bacterium]
MNELLLIVYTFFLVILLVYSFESLHLAITFKNKFKFKTDEPDDHELKSFPKVTIQLPVFNEKYVVQRLIDSVVQIDYPKEKLQIQVIDDSTDETLAISRELVKKYHAAGFAIELIHRSDRSGYKAGALKKALETATGEFIAIFDADFIPDQNFLKKTLIYFEDSQLGMVQSRWRYVNENYSKITRIQALALDGHFVVEQAARNAAGYFINFNGTAGVWRKSTILDAGNWQADTLTEDLDLSFRAQLKGWKFKYLVHFTTNSELPAEINGFKSQQYRWTKGAIETAKKLLPAIWKSGLSLRIKLQSTFHLTGNFVYPSIIILALLNMPLIYIKSHYIEYDLYFLFLSVFVLSMAGPFVLYFYSQKMMYSNWQDRLLLFPFFMSGSMGLAVNNSKAVLEALFGIRTAFKRTPKYAIEKESDNWLQKAYREDLNLIVIAELFMLLYSFITLMMTVVYLEIAAIPFHFMFFGGFLMISYLSLSHYYKFRTS